MATSVRLKFGASVNRVDTVAPTLVSASIPAAGTSLSIVLSKAVRVGAGGNGGFTIAMSGGAVTLTYASGANTNTWVYTTSRTINSGETCSDFDYTQPGNGVESLYTGIDLATFTNQQAGVTNNSTVSGGPTYTPVFSDNFDSGANGDVLGSRSGWTATRGVMNVLNPTTSAGSVYNNAAGTSAEAAVTATISADQYCECTLVITGTPNTYRGIGARNVSSGNFYGLIYQPSSGTLFLQENPGGAGPTPLSKSYSTGHKLRLRVTGTGSALRINADEDTGSGWVNVFTDYNPTLEYDTGNPCVASYDSSTAFSVDDFVAGNVT